MGRALCIYNETCITVAIAAWMQADSLLALSHPALPKRFLVETSGLSLVDRVNQGTSDECQVFAGSAVDPPLSNDLGSYRLQQ